MWLILRAFVACSGIRDSLSRGVANTARFSLNASVTSPKQNRTVRLPLATMLAALLIRAVIPLGYMPGNLLAGEFMVLCPTGLPASFSLSATHHHHGDVPMLDAERACPIGAALQQALLPTEAVETVAIDRFREVEFTPPAVLLPLDPPTRYRSRAPPHLS